MKVFKIKRVGRKEVYDLSVKDVEHYILENGVVTHNTGIQYSADTVFIIGRRQIKDGKEIDGYEFVINIDKSRYVREKSKLPLSVTFEGGINTYSGLLEMAQELGFVYKPSNVSYCRAFMDEETGELVPDEDNKYKKKDTSCTEFWKPLIQHEPFRKAVEERYALGNATMSDDELETEANGLFD